MSEIARMDDNLSSSLEVANMDIANEKYSKFVNVNQQILSQAEFKEAQNLPLNETIASVFYQKTAHLQDHDFIQIERDMLQTIGFKNTFGVKKDKHGNIKLDENGNPKMEDKRQDVNNAVKCLRNTTGFKESTSFDDTDAHFVLQKIGTAGAIRGGQNRQEVWIRMRALVHFIIMANTQNSYMIREYFIDLKKITDEYNMYVAVYNSKKELSLKDCHISCLVEEMRIQREQMHELISQSETKIITEITQIQQQNTEIKEQNTQMKQQNTEIKEQNTQMKQQITRIEDKVVLSIEDPKVKELMVVMHSSENDRYIALRTQERNKREAIKQCKKRYGADVEEAFAIVAYQNPRNLFHRFKDFILGDAELKKSIKFKRTTFETSMSTDDIKMMFLELEKSFQKSIATL